MMATKATCILAGAVLGAGVTTAASFAIAGQDAPRAAHAVPRSIVTISLVGANGRYLTFSGRGRALGPFAGRLAFEQPIQSGAYKLSVKLKDPAGHKTRLLYDVSLRERG